MIVCYVNFLACLIAYVTVSFTEVKFLDENVPTVESSLLVFYTQFETLLCYKSMILRRLPNLIIL
jgi:hypothetical protein